MNYQDDIAVAKKQLSSLPKEYGVDHTTILNAAKYKQWKS